MKAAFVLHEKKMPPRQACSHELTGPHSLLIEGKQARLQRRHQKPVITLVGGAKETLKPNFTHLVVEEGVKKLDHERAVALKELAVDSASPQRP